MTEPTNPANENHTLSRRTFLQASGLAVAAAAAASPAAHAGTARCATARREAPRNVIFMVSDGMSAGTLTLGSLVLREMHGERSAWLDLLATPGARRSLASTHSADCWVTDSAAGGCAWSIGRHVNNGTVNLTPDEQMLSPLLVRAKARGFSTGLVTTTTVTHATPAAFIANVPERSREAAIAAQIMQRGVDVCLGGGRQFFNDDLRAAHADVRIHDTLPDLASVDAGTRHLGLYADSHMPYVLDREATVPSLPGMTRAALSHLARNPGGFVLQVEGGRVDHAAHSNDASSLVAEQIEFERALRAAMEFTLGRDDTLLITTTDHGNANPGLTLYDRKDSGILARLTGATRSFDWVVPRLRDAAENNTLGSLIAEASGGFEMSADDEAFLRRGLVDRQRTDPFLARSRSTTSLLGSMLANYHGVSFLSPNHTADMVEVAAIGPGAELIEPVIDNIDLQSVMQRVLGLPDPEPMG